MAEPSSTTISTTPKRGIDGEAVDEVATTDDASLQRMANAVEVLLTEVGEDPSRQGLLKTPMRMARAFKFFTSGYRQNLDGA